MYDAPPALASFLAFASARFASFAFPPFGAFITAFEFDFGLNASLGAILTTHCELQQGFGVYFGSEKVDAEREILGLRPLGQLQPVSKVIPFAQSANEQVSMPRNAVGSANEKSLQITRSSTGTERSSQSDPCKIP